MGVVPEILDAVSPALVLAAGGIVDGRGVAAALALGADGVWIGTRLVATAEAAGHSAHKRGPGGGGGEGRGRSTRPRCRRCLDRDAARRNVGGGGPLRTQAAPVGGRGEQTVRSSIFG